MEHAVSSSSGRAHCAVSRGIIGDAATDGMAASVSDGPRVVAAPPTRTSSSPPHVGDFDGDSAPKKGEVLSSAASWGVEVDGAHQGLVRSNGFCASPRISSRIANSVSDLRKYCCDTLSSMQSSDKTTATRLQLPSSLTANGSACAAVASSSRSSLDSSRVLRGVGGGRRIFARVGARCVYDANTGDSNIPHERGFLTEETRAGARRCTERDGGDCSLVHPLQRCGSLSDLGLQVGEGGAAVSTRIASAPTRTTERSDGTLKKVLVPNFTDTHQRHTDCSFDDVVNDVGTMQIGFVGHENVYSAAYNSFFDDTDIPVVFMRSFRRSTHVSSQNR